MIFIYSIKCKKKQRIRFILYFKITSIGSVPNDYCCFLPQQMDGRVYFCPSGVWWTVGECPAYLQGLQGASFMSCLKNIHQAWATLKGYEKWVGGNEVVFIPQTETGCFLSYFLSVIIFSIKVVKGPNNLEFLIVLIAYSGIKGESCQRNRAYYCYITIGQWMGESASNSISKVHIS